MEVEATGEVSADCESRRNPRALAGWLLLTTCVCAVGICNSFGPTIRSGFTRLQTDAIDTRFNQFVLEHTWQCLSHGSTYPGSFWSPPVFHPYPRALALSDNLIGAAPLYWMTRWATTADASFGIWMIACTALSYAAMHFVLWRMRVHPLLAILGAFWFAFGLPHTLLLNHQQLLPQFYAPLALLAGWEFVRRPGVGRLSVLLLLIFLQLAAGIYLGWFLAFSVVVFFACVWIGDRAARTELLRMLRSRPFAIAATVLIACVVTTVCFWPYLVVKSDSGGWAYPQVAAYLPTLRSWLPQWKWSAYQSTLDAISGPMPDATENVDFFQGYLFLFSVLGGAILCLRTRNSSPERKFACVSLVVGGILILLSMRWVIGSLWHAVYALVPGASGIRAVSRIYSTAYLYLIVGAMIGASEVLQRSSAFRNVIVSLVLVIGIGEQMTSNLPSFHTPPFHQQADEIAQLLAPGDVGYLAIYRAASGNEFAEMQITAMWAALKANRPVVNGYSGKRPPGYPPLGRTLSPAKLKEWLGASSPAKLTIVAAKDPGLPPAWDTEFPGEKSFAQTDHFVAITIDLKGNAQSH